MGQSNTSSQPRLKSLDQESERFYSRFIRVGAGSIAAIAVLALVAGLMTRNVVSIAAGGASVVLNAVTFAMLRGDGSILGRRVFVYGITAIALAASMFGPAREQLAVFTVLAALLVTLAGFALRRIDLIVTSVLGASAVVIVWAKWVLEYGWNAELAGSHISAIGLVVVQIVAISLFTAHARDTQRKLRTHVDEIDRVMVAAQRIAKGDLACTIEGESEVSETIRAMLDGLRTLVTRTREATTALSSSAQEIAAMARQQEQGAVEQASAVTQVHKTLATVLEGSQHAAQSTDEVFRNVELTQKTSETVAQRAAALSAHTRRISAILEIIKSIANKSEILALNAALEGARAGEAGRGFSLVASQMQRLAESVMDSVRDVRSLVEDIEAATSATLAATEESTQLAAKATTAARQIGATLQRQRGSTEQVAAAMHDIEQVASQVSVGSSQALAATKDLTRLAGELKRTVEGFQL